MEYQIGPVRFKSKTLAQSLFKKYLACAEVGTRLEGEMDVLMRCQVSKHPKAQEKIGAGIGYFEVVRRADAFGSKGFDLVRVDGSRIDFSYTECFNTTGHRQKVLGALRHEVDEQVLAARRRLFGNDLDQLAPCAVTGKMLASTQAHIDHEYPATFSWIADEFLKQENLEFDQINVTEMDLFDCLSDRELARRWKVFHALRARLQPVEKKENIRNSNRSRNA